MGIPIRRTAVCCQDFGAKPCRAVLPLPLCPTALSPCRPHPFLVLLPIHPFLPLCSLVSTWGQKNPFLDFNFFFIFIFAFLFKILFIFIIFALRQSTSEISRESCTICWFHCPSAHNRQGWTRLRPGIWNSVQVSHVGYRDPSTWDSTCCLPGWAWTGRWIRSTGARTLLMWDVCISKGSILTAVSNVLCP